MILTFKDLPNNAQFHVPNLMQIIRNRGDCDREITPYFYGSENPPLIKRDEFGGHILCNENGWEGHEFSIYYRIEPDNEVETV